MESYLEMAKAMSSTVSSNYPIADKPKKIGSFPVEVFSGGGYLFDKVLEYRVWVRNKNVSSELYSFTNYEDALRFRNQTKGAEFPLALVYQAEYIAEPEEGEPVLIKQPRIAEWQVKWLEGNQRNEKNINNLLEDNVKP